MVDRYGTSLLLTLSCCLNCACPWTAQACGAVSRERSKELVAQAQHAACHLM